MEWGRHLFRLNLKKDFPKLIISPETLQKSSKIGLTATFDYKFILKNNKASLAKNW